jgi:hypothetical protein
MHRTMIERVGILILAVSQLGCQSVYRFECTSNPKGASVVVGGEVRGQTNCTVEIPKDSDLIQDGQVEFTFRLPDGRAKTKVVDVSGLKPSDPVVLTASLILGVAGIILLVPYALVDEEDPDPDYDDFARDAAWLGLGAFGTGAAVYYLFGGDELFGELCDVHVDFDQPADVNAPVSDDNEPTPVAPTETEN